MRVVHVITKADVGGAQSHVVELADAQRASGHDVSILAGCAGPALRRAESLGVAVGVLPQLLPWVLSLPRWGVRAALIEELRRRDPDVVHGHSSHAGLVARIAARQLGVASVYTAHGWPFQQGAGVGQRVSSALGESLGGRLGDAVICLTDAEADLARRWRVVPADKVWVVPNGLRDVPPALRRVPASGPLRLVMVARFAPPKRQADVVKALARLGGEDWTMTFVGDGVDFERTRTDALSQLPNRFDFQGSRDDVASVLARHDVHVLWTRYEGLPLAMLEAMRAGLCVVANDLPGTRALSGEAEAAVIPGDVDQIDALSAAIRALIDDRSNVDRRGAAARARFEQAFTIGMMVDKTDEVYDALVRRRRRT